MAPLLHLKHSILAAPRGPALAARFNVALASMVYACDEDQKPASLKKVN
ncbi:hypothetical protein [Pseudorhodobacter sp.]|nr:hypothetical protein [Pseudorhodobacter sp.]MDN5786722.1 hypothetical protein [Pseudorhodobacter sp.]